MPFPRSALATALAAALTLAPLSGAQAFIFPFGFGGLPAGTYEPQGKAAAPKAEPAPEPEARKSQRLRVDRLLPFFSASRGNLVVRINPDSEKMADPALRDAILALVMIGTRGVPKFPLDVQGADAPLVWAEPGRTLAAYDAAPQDFGGPAAEIVAIAEETGLVARNAPGLHREVAEGSAADRAAMRRSLRSIYQRLQEAGYTLDDARRLVNSEGDAVTVYLRPAGVVSAAQVGALAAIRSHADRLGISVVIQEQEALAYRSLVSTDVLVSVEGADRRSFVAWLEAFSFIDEIDAFIDALPSDPSPHQQVTSLALIDSYLAETGYALPIAVLPAGIDLSTTEARREFWKPMMAEAHVKAVCKHRRIEGYGRGAAGLLHSDGFHPLVILLPADGGPDETFAIYASKDQIGIEDRGVLVFQRAAARDETIEVPVRRLGHGSLLIMEDRATYLQLVDEYRGSRYHVATMEYRRADGVDPEKRYAIRDDAKGMIESRALRLHDMWDGVVACARTLAESDAPLVFGPVSSIR